MQNPVTILREEKQPVRKVKLLMHERETAFLKTRLAKRKTT